MRAATAPVVKARQDRAGRVWIPKARLTERRANRVAREALARLLENDFVETVATFRRGMDLGGIANGFASGGDLGIVNEAIGLNRMEGRLASTVLNRLNEAVAEGAQLGLRFAPPQVAGVSPGLVTEFAAGWIESEGGLLVAGVTERTRAGVQRALLDQLTGQVSPTRAAANIGDLVGLTPRQVGSVNTFRTGVERQLIPVAEAETVAARATVEARVRRETQRQLRMRGRLIADTEMQAAIQQGERAFWQVAQSEGAVDLQDVRKTWQTVDDGEVCEICFPMHGQEVAEQDSFSSDAGWMGEGPPAHPNCRCYITWLIVEEGQAA